MCVYVSVCVRVCVYVSVCVSVCARELVGWLVVFFYGVSTHSGTFNAELDFNKISLV